MKIDITKAEGNTMAALAYAARFMREAGMEKAEVDKLREGVFAAEDAKAAYALIEAATNGAIQFVDSRND